MYTLRSRSIPLNTDYDVIVVGGRRIAKQYRDALATYFPEAFGNAYLVATAPVIGVRESRMIDGCVHADGHGSQGLRTF